MKATKRNQWASAVLVLMMVIGTLCAVLPHLAIPSHAEGTYEKATSIAVGDTVVLVCESKTMELSSISTTSTKYGIGVAYSGAPAGTMPLEVVAGFSTGTFAFKTADGKYLYWSSGNSLNVNATLNANTSWNVSFDDGNAIILNGADNARKLQWNASSPRFACYTSAQTAIQLYKLAAECVHTYDNACDSTCNACGEERVVSHTPATDAAVAPTCTEPGLTEGSHCSVCSEVLVAQTVVPATGHNLVNGECTNSNCDFECDHSEGYTEVVTHPTCTEDGYTTHTCKADGCTYSYTSDTTNKLGHTPVTDAAVASTCTTTGLAEGSHCSVCSEVLVAQTVVPATGHNYVDGKCSVCCEKETSSNYVLVTDVSTLKAGDKIIIVAKGYNFAMGTTQNGNNRAQVAITKDGNIIIPGVDVQIITLEAGTVEGTFAFYVEGNSSNPTGYLYAASGSANHLKTQTTNNANGSWSITIDANDVATIKAQGDNARNWLRYNSTNNPPIFSCYGSGQADVCIYKMVTEYEHTYDNACDGECNVCKETREVSPHDFSEADCDTPKTCSKCGATEGDALGHKWVEANCDTPKTCSVCGATEGDVLGHTPATDAAVAPTCTESGLTEGSHCSVCGEVLVAQTEVLATGHHFVDGKCDNPNCDFECDHSEGYTADVTPPTCTEDGYTTYTCKEDGCTYSYTGNAIEATGHSYESFVTEPTCTEDGYTTHTCSTCGDTYEDSETEATGHSYDAVVTEPTCTEGGYTTHTCATCGDTYEDSKTEATGHSPETDAAVAPTCIATGLTEGSHCSVCNTVLVAQKEIPIATYTTIVSFSDLSDLSEGDVVVFIAEKGSAYYMLKPNGASAAPTAKAVDPQNLTADDVDECLFVVEILEDGQYKFKLQGSEDDYLYCINNNNGLRVGGGENNVFKIDDSSYLYNVGQSRYIGVYNAQDWRSYTSINDNIKNQSFQCNVETLNHTWVDADCDTPKTCSVCDATEGNPLGHSYVPVVTPPTCTEDGYTTHTCATCGDTYTSDTTEATGHNHEVTSDGTDTHTGTCACGDTFTEAHDFVGHVCDVCGQYEFAIAQVSLTLTESIAMNFKMLAGVSETYTNISATFYFTDRSGKVIEYTTNATEKDGYLVFTYPELSPKNAVDDVKIVVTADGDNTCEKTFSIRAYCEGMLVQGKGDAKLEAALIALLDYCAAAQIYDDYKTDDLANKNVANFADATKPTEATKDNTTNSLGITEKVDAPEATFKSVGLSIADNVSVRFKVNVALVEGMYVEFVMGENTYTTTTFEEVGEDTYYVYFANIAPTDLETVFTATVKNAEGVAISHTIQYSVASYAHGNQASANETLGNFMFAMLTYGKAVKNYAE